MGVTIAKTYTRNNTKELLVLRNKIAKCINKVANDLGYSVTSIINDQTNEGDEKSLTIVITKINDVEHESHSI